MEKTLNRINVTVGSTCQPLRSLRTCPARSTQAQPISFASRRKGFTAPPGLAIHRTIRLSRLSQHRTFLCLASPAEQVAVWLDGKRQDLLTRNGQQVRVHLMDAQQGRAQRLVVGLLGGQARLTGPLVLEQNIDICYTQELTEPLEAGGRWWAAMRSDATPGRFDTRSILDLDGLAFQVSGWSDKLPGPQVLGPCDAVPPEIVGLPLRRNWRVGCRARGLYLLGLTSTYDCGTGSWYRTSPDCSMEQFVGDQLGVVRIRYVGGSVQEVPLIFGFTMGYFGPMQVVGAQRMEDAPPFDMPGARRDLRRCLFLHDGYPQPDLAHVLKIQPRKGTIESIEIEGDARFLGRPVVSAITVQTDQPSEDLLPLPAMPSGKARPRAITPADLARRTIDRRIKAVQRHLYTFAEDIKTSYPLDVPKGFVGPRVRLGGDGLADMLTNIYHHSLLTTSLMVADDGTSAVLSDALPNFGSYRHAMGCFSRPTAKGFPKSYGLGNATWSRDAGRAVHELVRLGFATKADAAVSIFDNGLDLCDPPHWTRFWGAECTQKLMQTQDGSAYRGQPENDGHSLIILARFRTWHAMGRPADWARRRWARTRQAADWLVWQLEHPTVRHQPAGTIYNTGEVGTGWGDIYTHACTQAALEASAQLAQAVGQDGPARAYRRWGRRMTAAALEHMVIDEGGPAWNYIHTDDRYQRYNDWRTHCQSLGPAFMHADIHGFDLSGLGEEAIRISRNTLRRRLGEAVPPYYFAGPMGYGQAYITQTALMLDEMAHASELVAGIAKYTYHPTYMPWIVPEGTVCHPSGKYWHRMGMFANQVQIAEVLKVIAMVLGVDDVDLSTLRLMPRLPIGWNSASLTDQPVTIHSGGKVQRATLGYDYQIDARGARVSLRLDRPADNVAIRVGPFAKRPAGQVEVNGQRQPGKVIRSGDSWWVWIDGMSGERFDVAVSTARGEQS